MVSIMGVPAVCVLVCAVMVQIKAAAVPDPDLQKAEVVFSATNDLVKRWGRCGLGWSQFNNRCFRYMPGAKSWPRAEMTCRNMGANLASVHSIDEYHEIQRLIMTASHGFEEAWIGGTDSQENGLWLWSDGSAFDYSNWCHGEPNSYPGRKQDCLQMNHSSEKCWDDFGCDVRRPYVCAKKI